MDLKNLKQGKSTTLVDGTTITKLDGGYEITRPDATVGVLVYDKDSKVWQLTFGERIFALQATAKTVVEAAIAAWPAKPAPSTAKAGETSQSKRDKALARAVMAMNLGNDDNAAPGEAEAALAMVARIMSQHSITDEELRRAASAAKGEDAEPEDVIEYHFNVSVQGGHGPHRVAGYAAVVGAMGADCFFRRVRTPGMSYVGETITLTVIAQPSVVESIKAFLPIMELQMERMGEVISRRESHIARAAGKHHSAAGCYARRGFFRGFGAGVAERLRSGQEAELAETGNESKALVVVDRKAQVAHYMANHHPDLKAAKPMMYAAEGFAEGREAGYAFASPAVRDGAEPRVSINA